MNGKLTAAKAFATYSKACPEATYAELEAAFRVNGFHVYLIATVS